MCVPSFHVGGMLGLLVSLYSGDTTVIQPRFDAGVWLSLVATQRVNSAFLVPTMLARILDHPDLDTTDVSSLRVVSYGAAAAPVELVRRAMAQWPDVGLRQRVRPDRDPRRLHDALAGRPPRPGPGRLGRAARCPASRCGWSTPTPARTWRVDEVGELWVRSRPEHATGRCRGLAAHRRPGPPGRRRLPVTRRSAFRRHQPRRREVHPPRGGRGSCASTRPCARWRWSACPTPRWGSGSAWPWWWRAGHDDGPTLDELRHWCSGRLAPFKLSGGAGRGRRPTHERAGQAARGAWWSISSRQASRRGATP